jgi:hypothetical protein
MAIKINKKEEFEFKQKNFSLFMAFFILHGLTVLNLCCMRNEKKQPSLGRKSKLISIKTF